MLKLNDVQLFNTSRLLHVSILAQTFSHERAQDDFKRKPKFTNKRKYYAGNKSSKTNDDSFLHVKNFNPSSRLQKTSYQKQIKTSEGKMRNISKKSKRKELERNIRKSRNGKRNKGLNKS
jgi:hypothetical protein